MDRAAPEDAVDKTAATEAATRESWQFVPLDIVFSAVAIFAAAGLKLAGVFS